MKLGWGKDVGVGSYRISLLRAGGWGQGDCSWPKEGHYNINKNASLFGISLFILSELLLTQNHFSQFHSGEMCVGHRLLQSFRAAAPNRDDRVWQFPVV